MKHITQFSALLTTPTVSAGWYRLDHLSSSALATPLFTTIVVLVAICITLLTGADDA